MLLMGHVLSVRLKGKNQKLKGKERP